MSAEQDCPNNCRFFQNGGDCMDKKVPNESLFHSVLVLTGWASFILGLMIQEPVLSGSLLAIARVLP